ncbi:MAG: hypothetical protein KDC26_00160 [Armatimonadetes bacterium]|nr:hypothetical protein [Armatimonadota bacterium]
MISAGYEDRLALMAEKFIEFRDVIEDARRYGTNPTLEEKYASLRVVLQAHYRGLKAQLSPQFSKDPETSLVNGWGQCDAFEQLVAPPTLDLLIRTRARFLNERLELAAHVLFPPQRVHVS